MKQFLMGILLLAATHLLPAPTASAQELNYDPGIFYLCKNNEAVRAISENDEWTITFGTTDTLGHRYNHPVDFTFDSGSVIDSLTCPLQDVDSLLMFQPEPVMQEDVFVITREHFPYIQEVDYENNIIYFSPEVNQHFDMPHTQGDKVVCIIEEDPLPYGFVGIITRCYESEGRWAMECNETWFDLKTFYKSLIYTTLSKGRRESSNVASSPRRAKPTPDQLKDWILNKDFNITGNSYPEGSDHFSAEFNKGEGGIYFDMDVHGSLTSPNCIVKIYTFLDIDLNLNGNFAWKLPLWKRGKNEKDLNNLKKIQKYGTVSAAIEVDLLKMSGGVTGNIAGKASYYKEINLFKKSSEPVKDFSGIDASVTLHGEVSLMHYELDFSFTAGNKDVSGLSDEEKQNLQKELEDNGKTFIHGELNATIDVAYLEAKMVIKDYPYTHPKSPLDLMDNHKAIKDSRYINIGVDRPHLEVKASGQINLFGIWEPIKWNPDPVTIDDVVKHPTKKICYFPQGAVAAPIGLITPLEVKDVLSFYRDITTRIKTEGSNFCSWDFGVLTYNFEDNFFSLENYRDFGTHPARWFSGYETKGSSWVRKGTFSVFYTVFTDDGKYYSDLYYDDLYPIPYDLSTLKPEDGFGETTLKGKFDPAVLPDLNSDFIQNFRIGFVWGPKGCNLRENGTFIECFPDFTNASSNAFSKKIITEDEGEYKYASWMSYQMQGREALAFLAKEVEFSPRSVYSPLTLPATDVYYDRGTLNAEISDQMNDLAINDPDSEVGFRYVTYDKNGTRLANFDRYLDRSQLNNISNFYHLQLTGLIPNRKVSYTAVTRVKGKIYEIPLSEQSFTTRDPYDPTTKGNEVDRNQATIHGEIDEWLSVSPEYLDKVTLYFEYSEKEDMSSSKTIEVEKVANQNLYKHKLKGLKWGTTYYYRFVLEAPEEAKSVRRGKVETFETPDLFKPQSLTAYPTPKGLAFKVTMLPEAEEIINAGEEIVQMTVRYAQDRSQLKTPDNAHDVVMTWRCDKSDPADVKYYFCDSVPVLDVNHGYYYRAVSDYQGHISTLDSYNPTVVSVPTVEVTTGEATFDFDDARVDMQGHIQTSMPLHLERYQTDFICSFEYSTFEGYLPEDYEAVIVENDDPSDDVHDVQAQYNPATQDFQAMDVYMPSGDDDAVDYFYRGVFTQDTYPADPKVFGQVLSCTVYYYDPGVMAYIAPRYRDAQGQWQRTALPADIQRKLDKRRAERAAAGRRFDGTSIRN